MDEALLADLFARQDDVISRAQVLACGGQPHDIKRRVRRREWAMVLPGVYVAHTGPPTWEQRAVAGVLYAGSLDHQLRPVAAALAGHAALRAAVGASWRHHRDRAPIWVCIDHRRTVATRRGYRFVRTAGLEQRVDWLRTPPRLRPAEAALDLALGAPDQLAAVGLLADACQSRCVAASEILAAQAARPRVTGRAMLDGALTDIADGTCSALEHLFLTRVVRPHQLPLPTRQLVRKVVRDRSAGQEYRDAVWDEWRLVVELDGRLFHDHATQRDLDLDRDLDEVTEGRTAVRLGWGQVTRRACRTATRLAILLSRGGWDGAPALCPECPDA